LSSVEIFSFKNGEYSISEGPPIQDARYNFSAGYLYGSIYIFGGKRNETEILSSIESIFTFITTNVDAENDKPIPIDFILHQNYPNPFNPVTTITFEVPASIINNSFNISLSVYDVIGNRIEILVDSKFSPGKYNVEFDASRLPSGIYYYQLKSQDFVHTKKMILLK
jgi:hypothetical protein